MIYAGLATFVIVQKVTQCSSSSSGGSSQIQDYVA